MLFQKVKHVVFLGENNMFHRLKSGTCCFPRGKHHISLFEKWNMLFSSRKTACSTFGQHCFRALLEGAVRGVQLQKTCLILAPPQKWDRGSVRYQLCKRRFLKSCFFAASILGGHSPRGAPGNSRVGGVPPPRNPQLGYPNFCWKRFRPRNSAADRSSGPRPSWKKSARRGGAPPGVVGEFKEGKSRLVGI